MTWQHFRIKGMDCAEEVGLLRRELLPLVGDEERLRFDLINAKLSVALPAEGQAAALVAAIARTGLSATPWHDAISCSCCAPEESFWERRGRILLTVFSGLLILVAFLADSLTRGLTGALGGNHGVAPAGVVLLYLAAVLSGIWFVAPRAWASARRLRPDMNLLMFLAICGALLIDEYFEAATVTFLFALALMLESWSVGRARRAIRALMELAPQTARVLDGEGSNGEERPVAEVPPGSRVLVRPGEKVPMDGHVLEGHSAVDQSPLTGESIPVEKTAGDEVFAGSLNGDGLLVVEVERAAHDSTLAHILRLVEEAQSRRANSERWVERFAYWYTPAMLGVAALLAVLPPLILGGGWLHWLYQALVILVIACPCALVISTPVSIVAGLARAARAGVLIKGGVYLEMPARLRAVAFDKTGTLSSGRPRLEAVIPAEGFSERDLLALAASLEVQSGHPLARAVTAGAEAAGLPLRPVERLQLLQGRGVAGELDGRSYWVGSERLLVERDLGLAELAADAARLEDGGHTLLFVMNETRLLGLLAVRDALRPDAAEALAELERLGIEHRIILSGDNKRVAHALAGEVGADEVRAELLPADKARAVDELRVAYGSCAMVGDGVNDAPALAAADLGIAMGAVGSDAAIETADIALMTDDLRRLPWLLRHSRRVLRVIKENVILALGLKLVFMGLAVAGIATLWMAIAADMGASLLVIANGLRLLERGRPVAP